MSPQAVSWIGRKNARQNTGNSLSNIDILGLARVIRSYLGRVKSLRLHASSCLRLTRFSRMDEHFICSVVGGDLVDDNHCMSMGRTTEMTDVLGTYGYLFR
jgi:hypothetical protein